MKMSKCKEIQNYIQDYLDGKLPPEIAAEVEEHLNSCSACQEVYQEWWKLFQELNSFPEEQTSQGFTSRVMQHIGNEEAVVRQNWLERVHHVLTIPRISLRWAAALGVTFVVAVMGFNLYFPPVQPFCANNLTEITFTLQANASQVKSIAVVGDFNNWDPDRNPLQDENGDGIWTATLSLEPGRYEYMFILDGQKWVPDPEAYRYVRDGFGNKNAVIDISGCS